MGNLALLVGKTSNEVLLLVSVMFENPSWRTIKQDVVSESLLPPDSISSPTGEKKYIFIKSGLD